MANTDVFNKLSKAFKDQWEQVSSTLSGLLSAETVVSKIISETSEALSELKEIDTCLTNISKSRAALMFNVFAILVHKALTNRLRYCRDLVC